RVRHADGFRGKFFRFANGNEAGAEAIGERGREDEAARFHAGDEIDGVAVVMIAEAVDERMEALLVLEKCREVVEKNSRLGIVRHFADQLFQTIHSRGSNYISCVMLNSVSYCESSAADSSTAP